MVAEKIQEVKCPYTKRVDSGGYVEYHLSLASLVLFLYLPCVISCPDFLCGYSPVGDIFFCSCWICIAVMKLCYISKYRAMYNSHSNFTPFGGKLSYFFY